MSGVCLLFSSLSAQPVSERDGSKQIWLESSVQNSFQSVLPYYHYFNAGGRWSDQRTSFLQRVVASYSVVGVGRMRLEVGAEAYFRTAASRLYLQEAYVLPSYGVFQLLLGRVSEDKLYSAYPKPAIGDMGLSDNAAPITRVGVTLSDYLSVPGLKDWVSVHGALYHGWLDEERYIQSPLWHQKQAHLRLGSYKRHVSLLVGLRHYVTWGGERDGRRIYAYSLKNFWKVATAQPLSEEVEALNAGGNHIGVWDYALQVYTHLGDGSLYMQKVFDDDRQQLLLRRHTRAAFHNGLWGFSLKINALPNLDRLQYERLHTTRQSGPGLVDPTSDHSTVEDNFGYSFNGRDNLYNNYFYQSGYTFRGFVIGQALMITKARAERIGLPLRSYPEHEIVNHRIKAHHLSVGYHLTSNWQIDLDLTYTENYGTYFGYYGGLLKWEGLHTDPNYVYYFFPVKRQTYMQLSNIYHYTRWLFRLSLAVDRGDIYKSWGLQAGVRYDLFEL